jgi:diketogulonate reductase-like aldo/keto reductase
VTVSAATKMRKTPLPAGETVPVLGQGTWGLAERPTQRHEEIAALRVGLDLGMTLVDTAEMYADGGAERLVGEAIAGRRDEAFIVTKVLPANVERHRTIESCEASLRRLNTDYIDLYLLHWREPVTPLDEMLTAFERLVEAGKIRYWGVSNFDVVDLDEFASLPEAAALQTNQVLYNLARRGIEYDLLPWCRARHLPVMAYSPIEQGRLLKRHVLSRIALRRDATAPQVALAWVLQHPNVIAIPKASHITHVKENRAALDVLLTVEDLAELDRAFPPPVHKVPLEII